MYANPNAGTNLLPALPLARRRPRAHANRRASATALAAVHAAWRAADQAVAEASLPAYAEIDYAAFRQQVDRPDACTPAQSVITHDNCVLVVGRQREVLAKLALPWIDHWGVTHGARYFAPTRPCKIPLRAWLPLATARLYVGVVGSPLKLLGSPLLKLRRLANSAAQRAARRTHAAHGDPHWTTIRLTA